MSSALPLAFTRASIAFWRRRRRRHGDRAAKPIIDPIYIFEINRAVLTPASVAVEVPPVAPPAPSFFFLSCLAIIGRSVIAADVRGGRRARGAHRENTKQPSRNLWSARVAAVAGDGSGRRDHNA